MLWAIGRAQVNLLHLLSKLFICLWVGLHLSVAATIMHRPEPTKGIVEPTILSTEQPFNAHQSQYVGSRFFGYNSPAAAAREVFKPSTDSASIVVPSQKKIFSFGFSWGVVTSGGCFRIFMAYFTRPWTPIERAHILAQIFLWN